MVLIINKECKEAEPFCQCWIQRVPRPVSWQELMNQCRCGEDNDVREWNWENPYSANTSAVVVSNNLKQVTFHPFYSSGTAAVRGDTPMLRDQHYYWEVKMLSEPYGTDIMIGVGSNKMDVSDSQFKFMSLLGADTESYGMSYRGEVRHAAMVVNESPGFCQGSIIGVKVDMWLGTLEFYLNRKPLGISFHNLRRHPVLYPMVCSTAAQSSLRLIFAASWRASLLVDAAKTLAAAVRGSEDRLRLPPGLWYKLRSQYWVTLPNESCILDDEEVEQRMEVEPVKITRTILSEVLPSQYMNGFYVDSVDRGFRLVLWQ